MNILKIIIFVLVLITLFYVLYRVGINLVLGVILRSLRPEIILLLGLYYFINFLKGIRWRWLLLGTIPYAESFKLVLLNNFFNIVSPVRAGELWRINACKKYGLGSAVAATVIERVLDVISVISLIAISFSLMSFSVQSQVVKSMIGSLMVIVLAFVGLIVLQNKRFWQLVSKVISIEGSEHVQVKALLREKFVIGKCFILSIFVWALSITLFWLTANMITHISVLFASLTSLLSTLFGNTVLTIGGVAQVLTIIGILGTQIDYVNAVSVGVLTGLIYYWLQILVGYIIYIKSR